MNEKDLLRFNKENVYCAQSPRGYGFTHFAKKDFKCNATIMKGWGEIVKHQTSRYSIQIDRDKHFIPQQWTGKYWNHSCEANTFVRTRSSGFPDLVARRDIKAHEEITYAYYMTEYEWSSEAEENLILCQCGAKNCTGKIRSFSQLLLSEQIILERNQQLSSYLAELVKRKQRIWQNQLPYCHHIHYSSFQVERINAQEKQIINKSSLIALRNTI